METESYTVKTTGFEGPFGLLLALVEKRKLFINDVSLAQVTEDYLSYMGKLGGLPPSEVSHFILVASTLLLIKSKSLLPNLDLTPEEEGDIKNLEERLRLYELFTRLSLNVKNNFGKKIIYAPLERKNNVLIFLPDDQITKESMMTFAQNVLGSMPKKVFLPKVEVKPVVSIEEMIDKLTDRIKNSMKMSFKDLNGKVTTREEKVVVIVGFLAMLEMVRQGIIDAVQESHGGDIIMEKQELILETIENTENYEQ
ncbi:segregation/condensation protein A [Candidatus Nomurabacteria bacterium]|nr:segregation/condensation protein A [Candidatus Nomurabacteria bacterium]